MAASDSEEGSASLPVRGRHQPLGEADLGRQFLVRFWGVRGSYPVSSIATQRVGGHTACVEVNVGGQEIILDAGTGLIALGQRLNRQSASAGSASNLTLLFSHLHYDHILGLPFFDPLYQAGARLHLFGPRMAGKSLAKTLGAAITSPYFPVDLGEVPATCKFVTLETGDALWWHPDALAPTLERPESDRSASQEQGHEPGVVHVACLHSTAHPRHGCLVFRIEYGGHSLVYATDVEGRAEGDPTLIQFARGADVLIHDAQYRAEDYLAQKQGYGHSTPEMAVTVAQAAGVKRLILFHHDPEHDDAALEQLTCEAQAAFAGTMLAYEGLEIDML